MYFKAGRKVLGSNGWAIDQSLILKLCSEGANACSICGDLDTMNALIAEVLSQAIPIQDKFNAYKVKVMAAHAAGEFNEALNTAFDFRRQIGLPTLKNKPVNTLIIIKEFIKTNRSLGNRTAEDIGSLPDLTDDRIVMGQRMLELSASSSFAVSKHWETVRVVPLSFLLTSCHFSLGSTDCASSDYFSLGKGISEVWHQCEFL